MEYEISIIPPIALSKHELTLLQRALATDFTGTDVAKLMHLAVDNKVQIWRFRAQDAHGILVTMINELAYGTELYVWLLAGRNMVIYWQVLIETLDKFARAMGCRLIRSQSIPGVARFLQAHGFSPAYIVLIREVK